jgi:hypothetical protein
MGDGTRFSPASLSVTTAIRMVRVAAAWAILVDDEVADEMRQTMVISVVSLASSNTASSSSDGRLEWRGRQ